MALTPDEVRQLEDLKEREFSDDQQPGVPEGHRLINEAVDDESFGIDPWNRCTIGDIPVTSPEREFDEEKNEWKSEAQMQDELGELPVWEEEPDLGPAFAEPCPCGHVVNLRDKTRAGITGVRHIEGPDGRLHPLLKFTCKCGTENQVDGRVLPPDLCVVGDEADELMDYLAEECARAASHKPW